MLRVAIPALFGTASIGTAGLMDAIKKADGAWGLSAGADTPRLFDVRLVGLNRRSVMCRDGVSLHPAAVARDLPVPDLVVVPGLDDDLSPSFALNRGWAPAIDSVIWMIAASNSCAKRSTRAWSIPRQRYGCIGQTDCPTARVDRFSTELVRFHHL